MELESFSANKNIVIQKHITSQYVAKTWAWTKANIKD